MNDTPISLPDDEPVSWAELRPDAFARRLARRPLAWLPIGLCEPHGAPAALGLDALKAEWLCREAARRLGGIVAPTQAWTIHECGFHARWLEEEIGEADARLTALPPDLMGRLLLYQLRAFANAGFAAALVLSGHGGGSERDLAAVARVFSERFRFPVRVTTDAALVAGLHRGDHAGRFEISQLMASHPALVDSALIPSDDTPRPDRYALAADAARADAAHGRKILEDILAALGPAAEALCPAGTPPLRRRLTYAETEACWRQAWEGRGGWLSLSPRPGQTPVSPDSQWKPYERF